VKALFLTLRSRADSSEVRVTMLGTEIFGSHVVETNEVEHCFLDLICDVSFSTSLSASGISPGFRGGGEGGSFDQGDD
jgi:hypothetical protein